MALSVPRPGWQDLPPPVRNRISNELGARVLGWTTLPPGMAAGTKMQLQTSSGNVVCSAMNGDDPHGYARAQREIAVTAALPSTAPAPTQLWSFDEEIGPFGRWIVAGWALNDVRPVGDEWTDDEVAAALRLLREIGEIEVPAGEPYGDPGQELGPGPWRRLADQRPAGLQQFSPWLEPRLDALAEIAAHTEAVSGPHLVHGAPSRHTLLLPVVPGDRGLAIDWIHAARGAAFVDVVQLLLRIRAEGGPAPEVVLAKHPLPSGIDPNAITCLVTALTGYYIEQALSGSPAGAGSEQPVQHALARVGVEWLRRRLGF